MKWTFVISFVIFFLVEIFIIIQFSHQKKTIKLKSTVIPFVLYCLFIFVVYYFRFGISYYILLLALIAILFHTFVGQYLNYFYKSKTFDRYLHGFDSFTFALLFYLIFDNLMQTGGSREFLALFILFWGISLGAFYEVIEFAIDSKQKTHMQRGLKDTNYDIIYNILGSTVAAVFAYLTIL